MPDPSILEAVSADETDPKYVQTPTKNILDFQGQGGLMRPWYAHLIQPEGQLIEADSYLRNKLPFKGRWQTFLNGNDLMIPGVYQDLIKYGGVITKAADSNLLLFGREHWKRMIRIVSAQLGLDPAQTMIMRHIYSYHLDFDKLNPDGSITLSDDLIGYANLKSGLDPDGKGYVVLVGLMYFAEIHDKEHFADTEMSAEDIRNLVTSLR